MKTAVLIGCGGIGAGYDLDQDGRAFRRGKEGLSHAGAISGRDDLELVACVDPDHAVTAAVSSAFNIPHAFVSIDDLRAADINIDVAIIASPTGAHAQGVEAAISLGCKAIVCEKPLAENIQVAAGVIAQAQDAGVLLAVNYQRLWDPGFIALAARARAGEFGAVQGGQASYVKGVTHNGPHMVTLLQELCGPVSLAAVDRANRDDTERDADFVLALTEHEGARIQVLALDHRCYNIFETTVYFEHAVIHFEDGGRRVRIRKPMAHPLYPSFVCPEDEERFEMMKSGTLASVYDEVLRCLETGGALRRSAQWCSVAEEICEAVSKSRS